MIKKTTTENTTEPETLFMLTHLITLVTVVNENGNDITKSNKNSNKQLFNSLNK